MAGFAFGGGAEQRRHVVLAFHVGLVCEIQVAAVGLGLTCKGGLQVLFRLGAFECCHGNLLRGLNKMIANALNTVAPKTRQG
jgi:hypothetical protein